MMHLEFPPKYVHIAFSPITRRKSTKIYKQGESHDSESVDAQENRNYSNIDESS